ncbi:hypothetical protein I4U23_029497 [Adineta vaga]|nr:hypothetical protein I4U23_029497 [Adineta vaga]
MNTISNTSTGSDISAIITISSLSYIGEAINRFVLIIYLILGIIGNISNILLFTSPNLVRTSTSFYLFFAALSNLFVITFVISLRLLADGFSNDLTSYSLAVSLPPLFTVLACADRWTASCVQIHRRRFATIYIAKRIIPCTIIFCCLLYLHIPITYNIDLRPPPPYCSVSVVYAIIGIIINVRQERNRVQPDVQLTNRPANRIIIRRYPRRHLSQMQVMLICQSVIECIVALSFGIINIVSIIVNNDERFLFAYSFIRLFIFFNYVSSFYIYTMSSKMYRQELKKLVKKFFRYIKYNH